MNVGTIRMESFIRSCLWLACVMGLALGSMTGPVQAQVEKVEELRYPPLPELVIPEPERVVLDNGMEFFSWKTMNCL